MKLLIVDDDLHVIEGIRRNIKWEDLKIDQIYSAAGVAAAKRILKNNSVDIIISDIEMPQETGVDLLKWITQTQMESQMIFLTCHASFEYAQTAISFNVLDYILKPVDYRKLEFAIANAVDFCLKNKQQNEWKENNEHWVKNRQNVVSYFWHRILHGACVEEVETSGLQYIKKMLFLPIVIQNVYNQKGAKWEGIAEDIRSVAEKQWNFCMISELESLIRVSEQTGVILLKTKMHTALDILRDEVENFSKAMMTGMKDRGVNIVCCIGMWSTVDLVYENVKQIQTMLYESPKYLNQAQYLTEYRPVDMVYEVPDIKNWKEMMRTGELEQLKKAIREHLNVLERQKKLSSRTLQRFGHDVTQMVYAYLEETNICAHTLFDSAEENELFEQARLSSQNMMEYLDYLLAKVREQKSLAEQPKIAIKMIKKYMDDNFQRNISREDLSQLVFLNADYLSRLFKKEMGVSISNYLIQKRIKLAKKLLISTKIPVSVISAQVGYDNFSYFSKVFKEKTGMTPNEYRKYSCKGIGIINGM